MSIKLLKSQVPAMLNCTDLLETVLDSMASGVFLVSLEGQIIYWNKAAEKITGYSSHEIVGKACGQLPGEDCNEYSCHMGILDCGLFTDTCRIERECRIVNKNGSVLDVLKSARVVHDDLGNPVLGIVNLVDVTRIREADREIHYLRSRIPPFNSLENLVGNTPVMHKLFTDIQFAADSDASVVISGESGTGKELVAHAVHNLSNRRNKPFITVNCCSLPETLLESELFGHMKGSFTGAICDKKGKFEAADGGTLFIDEIGDLSLTVQIKLLRFLQSRIVERVGEIQSRKLDVRIIAATNLDLRERLASGQFRGDLFYRINVFPITVMSLRDRKEDIPLLVDHFLIKISNRTGKNVTHVTDNVMQSLLAYPWPGNVRELENAIEHAFVRMQNETITLADLPEHVVCNSTPDPTGMAVGDNTIPDKKNESAGKLTRERILDALNIHGWRREKTAETLGVSRITLWKKMKKYQIVNS